MGHVAGQSRCAVLMDAQQQQGGIKSFATPSRSFVAAKIACLDHHFLSAGQPQGNPPQALISHLLGTGLGQFSGFFLERRMIDLTLNGPSRDQAPQPIRQPLHVPLPIQDVAGSLQDRTIAPQLLQLLRYLLDVCLDFANNGLARRIVYSFHRHRLLAQAKGEHFPHDGYGRFGVFLSTSVTDDLATLPV